MIAHFSASYDLVLPATRVAALVVFLLLMPAAIVLWGTPAHTADRWAWTITPNLTAIFLGSGYGAGAFFFWRTYRAERWHPSSAGVLGASAFAALMLLATLLHWDAFNHGHAPFPAAFAFWGSTIVYIISPPILFALWWRNRATDSRTATARRPVHAGGLLARGARVRRPGPGDGRRLLHLAVGCDARVSWKLTPLTARVLASVIAQVGVGAMVLSFERRWSGWQLIIQTFFVATALPLVGAAREFGDFGPSGVVPRSTSAASSLPTSRSWCSTRGWSGRSAGGQRVGDRVDGGQPGRELVAEAVAHRELARRGVGELGLLAVAPDEHLERQVERRLGHRLHHRRPGLGSAEDRHLGVAQSEPGCLGLAAVVDDVEQLDPLGVEQLPQPRDGVGDRQGRELGRQPGAAGRCTAPAPGGGSSGWSRPPTNTSWIMRGANRPWPVTPGISSSHAATAAGSAMGPV